MSIISRDKRSVVRRKSGMSTDDQPTGAPPGHFTSTHWPSEPTLGTTATWGPLDLYEEIGRGTFGRVYRAWDRALKREVALKLIELPGADSSAASDVLREGQLLARVRHPNVVAVYGALREGNVIGIWMEFVRGHTLADLVRRDGALGADEASVLAINVCRALAAVHAAGLVHRDVKANNVMREEGGRIVLMDFGTGRELADSRDAVGDTTGTPMYMAPEVLLGQTASIQSDIYSVGVLLYFLVTSRYPIDGRTVQEMVEAHARRLLRPLVDARPDLPDRFVRIVERALSAAPDQRYPSAGAMMRALAEGALTPPAARARAQEPLVLGPEPVTPAGVLRTPRSLHRAGRQKAPARPVERRAGLWLAGAAGAFLVIWLFGFLTSMAFNTMLDVPLAFAGDSPMGWWKWGFMSLVAPASYMTMVTVAALALGSIRRLLTRIFPTLRIVWERTASRLRDIRVRYRMDDASTEAQALLALNILIVALVIWAFRDLFGVLLNYGTQQDSLALELLRPANFEMLSAYRAAVDVTILALTIAWWRIWKKLRQSPERSSAFPTILAGLGANTMLILVIVLPYRIIVYNNFERVDLAELRCYQIGQQSNAILLHCPDVLPPKNRIVTAGDPRLRRTGAVESIFTPATRP